MVHYKLIYFNVRALAEASRQIFHLAGVPFEDVRIQRNDPTWETDIKKSTPFGKMPVLSVDGFDIPQSAAIARYLSRKFGFAGKTPEEEAWVDAIVDQFKDFFEDLRKFIIANRLGKPAEEIEKIRNEIVNPSRDNYLRIITGILQKSKSGFLVGDNVTFADLVIADSLVTLEKNGFFKKEDYPIAANHQLKIHNLPKLKEWIETRPDTQL
ncbi:unnamed protein product [Caenorhabditis angaria]|uniref:glutathione transferase n=1 Tax=Caenorhabditis angaria TaxID=860376 RepID=A0A9P1IER5_9PELO|nr:unnamed protein product [Caenorhabditis angaria]